MMTKKVNIRKRTNLYVLQYYYLLLPYAAFGIAKIFEKLNLIIKNERNEILMNNTIKQISKNPTAYHNYNIEEKIEAGIVLSGTEIKSIRQGKVNLKDTYAIIKNGEVFIVGMHISPYEQGNIFNKDPLRDRKLLLNKREIAKLIGLIKQKGYSLIPISLYFKGDLVKVELGVGKGKKLYDKRQDLAKKDAERQIAYQLKNRNM